MRHASVCILAERLGSNCGKAGVALPRGIFSKEDRQTAVKPGRRLRISDRCAHAAMYCALTIQHPSQEAKDEAKPPFAARPMPSIPEDS
nr:hypothetical protein CFP56_43869 [Quercus suber]